MRVARCGQEIGHLIRADECSTCLPGSEISGMDDDAKDSLCVGERVIFSKDSRSCKTCFSR